MPLPAQYSSLTQWFSAVVNVLNVKQNDFTVIQKYWSQLTQAQQTAMKADATTTIAAQITELQNISTYIGTL